MALRKSLILLTFTLMSLAAWSATSLSVASRLQLRHLQDKLCRMPGQYYQAFIELSDRDGIDGLRSRGVLVDAVFDGFVTARIPATGVEDVMSTDGVCLVSLAQPLHWRNDSALLLSNVEPAHHVGGCYGAFDGTDVIVGIIDSGIDFNHINLCDDKGVSRVRAIYLPADTSGRHPTVDGFDLPGSCYETAPEIASLTTDFTGSSHGTHTLGTAAGSYRANGWNGVASGADLVACGIPSEELTDVNIANAVKYIFDYANRVGKPCVINMSLGSNSGPNDGTSFLCRVFSSLSGPGRICVVSAGNDGDAPICFRYTINHQADTVTTFLRNQWGGMQRQGYVSMWSDRDQMHQTRLVIVNRYTGELEYASPFMGTLPEDSVFTITSEQDPAFAAYYSGKMMFASGVESQFKDAGQSLTGESRFHSYWEFDVESLQSGHLIGLQYVGESGTTLVGWCTKQAYFYTFGMPGATGGSSYGSISDLATTDSVISVGAYCSRQSYVDWSGQTVYYDNRRSGAIAPFSSFGPDENGTMRPDVCAPGAVVISSANRYDMVSNRSLWPPVAVENGESYPYYPNQGTSMSAPVVTGAIALMLQLNPELSTADVREVLKRSSTRDEMTDQGNAQQWGSGKLDVWAAVNDVITDTMTHGDVNDDGEINIADVMSIIHIILGEPSSFSVSRRVRADVNRNREINIADVNQVINMILKN